MAAETSADMVKAVALSALGAALLVRGFFRPTRALAKYGEIRRCSGGNSFGVCDPTIGIVTEAGAEVFSAASGEVAFVGKDFVHVVARQSPVILFYQGIEPTVRVGQHIGVGQVVGYSMGSVSFGVTQMGPNRVANIPPSAWLASVGFKVLGENAGDAALWCAQGRHISVPSAARQTCEMKQPEAASFALLPVSVEMN